MKIRIALILLSLIPSHSFGDFEELTVTKVGKAGSTQICSKSFFDPQPQCVEIRPVALPLPSQASDVKLQQLILTDVGVVHHKDGTTQFGAEIDWQGQSAGLLSISGPQGEIFAQGYLIRENGTLQVQIDNFSDAELSQQFDRAVLFGEPDPMRLHAKTKLWLETVLAPAIETYLNQSGTPLERKP